MMNDKFFFEILYNYIQKLNIEDQINILETPQVYWCRFIRETLSLEGIYEEIRYIMRGIVSEIHRKDRLKCQYCRIDEGLLVQPPIEPHNLCKLHFQDYETQFEDRTLTQKHPGAINGAT